MDPVYAGENLLEQARRMTYAMCRARYRYWPDLILVQLRVIRRMILGGNSADT